MNGDNVKLTSIFNVVFHIIDHILERITTVVKKCLWSAHYKSSEYNALLLFMHFS